MVKRIFVVSLVATLSLGWLGIACAAESYDATVDSLFHGFLLVVDTQCHHHSLSFSDSGGVSRRAFDAWGDHHYNIHVASRNDGELEIAEEIHPRDGANAISKCASEEQSFGTHVDGRVTMWSEGNAIGGFDLVTSAGATRHFGFLTGKEPTVNGHHVFCESAPNPDVGCEGLKALLTLNRTRVRVYYRIVDSPDGPSDEVVRIQTL
jgi:hypothetical protein